MSAYVIFIREQTNNPEELMLYRLPIRMHCNTD